MWRGGVENDRNAQFSVNNLSEMHADSTKRKGGRVVSDAGAPRSPMHSEALRSARPVPGAAAKMCARQ